MFCTHREPIITRSGLASNRQITVNGPSGGEGNGSEMFQAICKLGLEGIVLKEAQRAVQVRAVKGVVEDQKSEGLCGNSRR